MKNMKILVASLALLLGVLLAFAMQPKESANAITHSWQEENGQIVLIGTTADAEANCPGSGRFCLRAVDSPSLVVYQE
jgi:hypothetical protein